MKGAWITDMRHFLDPRGRVVEKLPPAARHIGSIVDVVSPLEPGGIHTLGVPCRRRPARQRCPGMVVARIDPGTGEIAWQCPECDDHGYVSNWQDTPWDRRPGHSSPSRAKPVRESTGLTPKARTAWNALAPEKRLLMLNNVWCATCSAGASMALDSGAVSGADLILRGRCTKCGGPVARVVEEVCR